MTNIKFYSVVGLLVFFLSCSSSENLTMSGGYNFYGLDFREYADKDFLITPESPTGNYVSLGLIEVEFIPEIKQITQDLFNMNIKTGKLNEGDKKYNLQAINGVSGETEYYAIEEANVQKVINQIYEKSIEWGANSLYNFTITSQNIQGTINYTIINISGFAIER